MRNRILSTIGRVMEVPPESLSDESSPENVAKWESLRHMNLMMALEQEFDIRFTDEQIMEMVNVRKIANTVAELVNS